MTQSTTGTGEIKLRGVGAFHGPSPYAQEPVVVADLAIDETARANADALIAATRDRFAGWGLEDLPVPTGDASEALAQFALIWAHGALTQSPGLIAPRGLHRMNDGRFRIWIGFHHPGTSQLALTLAADVLSTALDVKPSDEQVNRLAELEAACQRHHPQLQDQIIMAGARGADVPFQRAWQLQRTWLFGWGSRSELIAAGSSNRNGAVTYGIASNKVLSKKMIEGLGLPTPRHALVRSDKEVARVVRTVGFPCVVKPSNSYGGKGVSAKLTTIDQVYEAIAHARLFTNQQIIVEQFIPGADHRLWFQSGRLVAAIRRDPPAITGDGTRTIQELVDNLNRNRADGGRIGFEKLTAVELDDALIMHLARQGMALETILEEGQHVALRSNANVSGGGGIEIVSDDVHPDIVLASEMLAQTLDFGMAGLDYITTDITRSWQEVPGSFIELNPAPVCQMLTALGWSNEEAGKVALGTDTGRIPLQLVVVPDALLNTATQHISAILPDAHIGLASHDRAQIGDMQLALSHQKLWNGVSIMLAHGAVERAVVLAGSDRIRRHGLPVDRADRIWNCDPDLMAQWSTALAQSSRSDVWQGDWASFASEFKVEDLSGATAA